MSLSLLYSLARRGRDTLQSETSLNFSFSVHGVKTTNLLVLSHFFPQGESSRPRGRKVILKCRERTVLLLHTLDRGACVPQREGCTAYSSPGRYEIEVGEEEDLNHSGNTIPSPVWVPLFPLTEKYGPCREDPTTHARKRQKPPVRRLLVIAPRGSPLRPQYAYQHHILLSTTATKKTY